MGQRRAGDPGDSDDVYVQDPSPLTVVVLADVAGGPDASVVHQDVEGTQLFDHCCDCPVDAGSVGDIAEHGQHSIGCPLGVSIQYGNPSHLGTGAVARWPRRSR